MCRELEKEIKEEIQATGAMGSTVDSPVSNRRKSGPTDYDHSVQSVRRAAKVQQVSPSWILAACSFSLLFNFLFSRCAITGGSWRNSLFNRRKLLRSLSRC